MSLKPFQTNEDLFFFKPEQFGFCGAWFLVRLLCPRHSGSVCALCVCERKFVGAMPWHYVGRYSRCWSDAWRSYSGYNVLGGLVQEHVEVMASLPLKVLRLDGNFVVEIHLLRYGIVGLESGYEKVACFLSRLRKERR